MWALPLFIRARRTNLGRSHSQNHSSLKEGIPPLKLANRFLMALIAPMIHLSCALPVSHVSIESRTNQVAGLSASGTFRLVPHPRKSVPHNLAYAACTGLINRDMTATPVYTIWNEGGANFPDEDTKSIDEEWARLLLSSYTKKDATTDEILNECLSGQPTAAAKGYILYDISTQQRLLPNILTAAGVLDAVPIDVSLEATLSSGVPKVFDAVTEWKDLEPYQVTEKAFGEWANKTSNMAYWRPAIQNNEASHGDPPLRPVSELRLEFVDYIVKMKLFTSYLWNQCIPFTHDFGVNARITTTNPWPKPLRIYGYDDTYSIQGNLL